jgi:hypothetical protein
MPIFLESMECMGTYVERVDRVRPLVTFMWAIGVYWYICIVCIYTTLYSLEHTV